MATVGLYFQPTLVPTPAGITSWPKAMSAAAARTRALALSLVIAAVVGLPAKLGAT